MGIKSHGGRAALKLTMTSLQCLITHLRGHEEQWMREKRISESRPVYFLQDDIKVCAVAKIQRGLELFVNVILLSENFILTNCITNPLFY